MDIWKTVPPELINGHQIEASNTGKLRNQTTLKILKTHKGSVNSHGIFSTFQLDGKTKYVHHLVFWAHSGLPVKQLQNGRVIFKSKLTEGGVIDGMLTNRYEDLLFQPSKDFDIEIPEESFDKHPLYGDFMYGHWYVVHAPAKTAERTLFECPMYELCLLDRADVPCAIRHTANPTKFIKMETVASTDPSVTLSPEKGKPLKYKLVHIVLASVFPTIAPDETVDHVDLNANNHHIKNLQWVSMAKNAKGGQAKSVEVRKENLTKHKKEPNSLPGEEWRPLTLNPHTAKLYQVSNMGRIKNSRGITRGSVIRGKNYSYLSINIAPGINKKEYIHRLVYQVFCAEDPYAPIPEDMSILHTDVTDGSVYINGPHGTPIYRNWACDLRLGTKTENNKEYHANKRAKVV